MRTVDRGCVPRVVGLAGTRQRLQANSSERSRPTSTSASAPSSLRSLQLSSQLLDRRSYSPRSCHRQSLTSKPCAISASASPMHLHPNPSATRSHAPTLSTIKTQARPTAAALPSIHRRSSTFEAHQSNDPDPPPQSRELARLPPPLFLQLAPSPTPDPLPPPTPPVRHPYAHPPSPRQGSRTKGYPLAACVAFGDYFFVHVLGFSSLPRYAILRTKVVGIFAILRISNMILVTKVWLI